MAQESPSQGYCHVHMEERENDLQEIALLISVICALVKSRLTYLATMAMEQWERYSSRDYTVFTFFVRTGLTYTQ